MKCDWYIPYEGARRGRCGQPADRYLASETLVPWDITLCPEHWVILEERMRMRSLMMAMGVQGAYYDRG